MAGGDQEAGKEPGLSAGPPAGGSLGRVTDTWSRPRTDLKPTDGLVCGGHAPEAPILPTARQQLGRSAPRGQLAADKGWRLVWGPLRSPSASQLWRIAGP